MKKSAYLIGLALGASTLTFAQVGIGTSFPSSPLDIETTGPAIDINDTGGGDPEVNFQVSGTTTFSIGIDNSDSDKLKIGTTAPDASTRMTINSSGNVGIGTSSPAYKLDVNGDIRIPQNYAADGQSNKILFYSNPGFNFAGLNYVGGNLGDEQANSYLNFFTGNTSRLVIKQDGKVGIGTTSPTYGLEVRNTTTALSGTGTMYISSSLNGSGKGLVIDAETRTIAEDAISALEVINNLGNPGLVVQVDGNVGIGTSSPSVELDVNGDIEYTGTITDVSDRRLKENFSSIDSVLTKIMKIKGLSYNMINDTLKTREYGVIAQDVQAVFPEMVTTVDPENGYLGVAYIQLIPVLLEGMKEQQAIIESQKAEIESLKAEASSATSSSEENAQKLAELEAKLNALLQAQTATVSAVK